MRTKYKWVYMTICCLSFILSWTCWGRMFSHMFCKSKAHCHWPASTYTVFCWSAKIYLWVLFLSRLWIKLFVQKWWKNILKVVVLVFRGKKFQMRKAFDYSMLGLSHLFFSFWVFISPHSEYSRKIISAALTNCGILIIQTKIFPLRFLWLIYLSFGLQNTLISLPAILFLSSLCFWLAASYIQPLPTLGLECSYLTLCCCWVCDNFMPLLWLIKLTKPTLCSINWEWGYGDVMSISDSLISI